jgi:hypothetical protein
MLAINSRFWRTLKVTSVVAFRCSTALRSLSFSLASR